MSNEPSHEGIYHFTGMRRTAKRIYTVTTNDLISVERLPNGDLAAYFFGRAAPYRIDAFTGTWRPVRIEFGGERCS